MSVARARKLPRIRGAGLPPTLHDLVRIERAEARRRPLHHGGIDLADLGIERGNPATDGRFVVQLPARGELLLHLAERLQRWRQYGDLLALDELLHPPVRVVLIADIRQWLAGPRQVVEGSLLPGDTDLRVDPRLPARPRR